MNLDNLVVNELDAVEERVKHVEYLMKDKECSVSLNGNPIDLEYYENGTLSIKDLGNCRCNSKGYIEMIKKLDNESLDRLVRSVVSNVTTIKEGCITYEEILVNVIVPELLKRIK